MALTVADLQDLEANLDNFQEADLRSILGDLTETVTVGEKEIAQDDFMAFVRKVWPNFIHGKHHEKMAKQFERVARGECKRLKIGRAHV